MPQDKTADQVLSIYPVDVIKSKLQTDALDPAKRQYKGMIDCVAKVWRSQGWRGFTGGLGPTLIRQAILFHSRYPKSLADVGAGRHSQMAPRSSPSSLPCGPWHDSGSGFGRDAHSAFFYTHMQNL